VRTGEDLVRHLNSFSLDLKFSAGVWFFAPGGGRFHDRYTPSKTMEQILEEAAALKDYGLTALEGHYPNEINEDNLDLFKQFRADTGIRVVTVVPNLFYDARFEWGSLSNPDPAVRQYAIDRLKTTLQLNQALDTDFAIVWPGIDGYENTFAHNHAAARARFADGLIEAMDAVPGVRLAEEPKPYEPRGNILFGTTAQGMLAAHRVEAGLCAPENRTLLEQGHKMFCLNPEVGHVLMGYEDLAYSFSLACEEGRLAHTHWNAQPAGNYDQDLNVGVLGIEQAEAALYALKTHGYSQYFGLDLNPERMPVRQALINCIDALRGMNAFIDRLDHAALMESTEKPVENRGRLESVLIKARYGK
jgi:xylose isomerase